MSQIAFYLCHLKTSQLNFFNKEFEPVAAESLSGLFAYIFFKKTSILIISNLTGYQSNHAGINLIQKALIKRLSEKTLRQPIDITLSRNEPDFGGELLLLKGEIIFWNFKSRSYSEKYEALHDGSLNLKQQIMESGLLPKRFINIKRAEYFQENYLKIYFAPNGQYRQNPYQVVQLLSAALDLPPLLNNHQKLSGPIIEAGAKHKANHPPITAADNSFSFFSRALENRSVALEPDLPKI
ncbi:Uncharacterised protein [Legionella busanensis]|uniref:Uncharacterized protein n=1 Tax=Legionella busanensis TaxID=190655 RepID=A0A378JKE4_9GAMM|nr:hypothetical protein [Legionella busanensis]STX50689.1 Uncharacterised protein [Legionella busanensis]